VAREPAPPPAASPGHSQPRSSPELAAWAVQVGSFGTEANALSLRERLRRKGYPAYVEITKNDGSTLYRVRIGPTVEREEAEKLRATVSKKESLKGLVVPHP
jgi:DedD protein